MFVVTAVSGLTWGLINVALRMRGMEWAVGGGCCGGAAYSGLTARKRAELANHAVAFAHAVVSSLGAIWCCVSFMASPEYNWSVRTLVETSNRQHCLPCALFWVELTLGYFLYDLVALTLSPGAKPIEYAHHLISAGQYVVMVYYDWAMYIPILLQTNEISTPFLHASWFMMQTRLNGTPIHTAVQLAFAVMFLANRILFDIFVLVLTLWTFFGVFPTVVPPFVPVISLIAISAYYAVQCVWGFAICRRLYQAIYPPPHDPLHDVEKNEL
jgi:hypothetical protein